MATLLRAAFDAVLALVPSARGIAGCSGKADTPPALLVLSDELLSGKTSRDAVSVVSVVFTITNLAE